MPGTDFTKHRSEFRKANTLVEHSLNVAFAQVQKVARYTEGAILKCEFTQHDLELTRVKLGAVEEKRKELQEKCDQLVADSASFGSTD